MGHPFPCLLLLNDFTIDFNCWVSSPPPIFPERKVMQKFLSTLGWDPSSLRTHPNGCLRCLLCFTIQSRDFDQMHHSEWMTPPRRRKKKTPHCVLLLFAKLLPKQIFFKWTLQSGHLVTTYNGKLPTRYFLWLVNVCVWLLCHTQC